MPTGLTVPDLHGEPLLEPEELKAAYILSKKPLLKQPPQPNEAVRFSAGMAGFPGPKGDGKLGGKASTPGLRRVTDFATGKICGQASCAPRYM